MTDMTNLTQLDDVIATMVESKIDDFTKPELLELKKIHDEQTRHAMQARINAIVTLQESADKVQIALIENGYEQEYDSISEEYARLKTKLELMDIKHSLETHDIHDIKAVLGTGLGTGVGAIDEI